MAKITKLNELKKIAAKQKKQGKRIVFTNGCFDILHYGHLMYLRKCKNLGDILIVGLNSDLSVKKIKGRKRPLTGEKERAAILSSLEFVDYVTVFNHPTPANLIRAISPNILAKGGDWSGKDIVGRRHVINHGGKVVTIPFVRGYSTTQIIKRIKQTF